MNTKEHIQKHTISSIYRMIKNAASCGRFSIEVDIGLENAKSVGNIFSEKGFNVEYNLAGYLKINWSFK